MIACWIPIGGGGVKENHYIGWGVVENGWQPIVDIVAASEPVFTALESPRRVVLHNPFGLWDWAGRDDQMVMDQERRCTADSRLKKVTETFSAWKPLIKSGWEVVAYIGHETTLMRSALTRLNAFQDSLNRIISTGCSIGFDSAATWSVDDRRAEPRMVRLLESWGVKCYVEGAPLPEWRYTPVIMETQNEAWQEVNTFYRRADSLLRIMPRPDDFDAEMNLARFARNLGWTACVEFGRWTDDEKRKQLVAALL